MSDCCSDLNISEYEYLKFMSKEAWAWEFTRRNSSYIKAWKKFNKNRVDDDVISTNEMVEAAKFGLLFFINPNLDARMTSVFWAQKSVNVLKCSLIEHNHSVLTEGLLLLADLDINLTYIKSEDGHSHLLLKDEFSSLQLIFDENLDLNTIFDFEIHLPAFCNLSKKIKSVVRLEKLLNCYKLDYSNKLSSFKSEQYIQILFAFDLRNIGLKQREVAKKLFGNDAIIDGWDGLGEYTRTKIRRVIAHGKELVEAGHITFF